MTGGRLTSHDMIAQLVPLCPGIDDEVVRDFVSRMDPEYFTQLDVETIAQHLRLIAALTLDHPCELSIRPREGGRFDITVVAYDYFSEFATICGLLSAFGLNIEEGRIYTFAEATSSAKMPVCTPWPIRRPKVRPGLGRKKIVDMFVVRPAPDQPFTVSHQAQLREMLTGMIRLLDTGNFEEARQQVNRRLIERLSKQRSSFTGLLHTVHITFDNSQSPTDTIMDIRSDDTPAFLYAFANALAMRNIYIAKAQFEIEGGKLHDRFFVRNGHGQKLSDLAEQQQLRLTAVLIKQFTHALTWAPDPAKALEAFDQFLDLTVQDTKGKAQQEALAFLSDKKTFPLLARLLGASDFLWEDFLRRQHGNLLPLLQDYRDASLIKPKAALRKGLDRLLSRAKTNEARKEVLNRFKDRELFRIDMKHIVEPGTSLADFSLALTELAEVIVDRSLQDCQAKLNKQYGAPRLANKNPCPFAILGMGKFGGRELGYASDIEVLFVYGGPGRTSSKHGIENSEYFERLAQELLQWIEAKQEGIFRVDVRLRPHGGKGSLTNPLEEIVSYYSPTGLAAPFERQALIKLRHVAGDAALGKQVEAHRDHYVYSGAPWDLATALDLRRQQLKQLVEWGTVNVKLSPGGVIDIEYAVQYLQVMHGDKHAVLRTPNTMQALAGLVECGIVSRQDGENLRKAYFFIRMLIDGLRMVRGNAKDLVLPPADSDEFIFLARRVGYTTDDWRSGARHLQTDIEHHMTLTKDFFERTFGALKEKENDTVSLERIDSPSKI
jgi:[glutamine synthetase] adenylyltransferase / [glutamine synthetase]-adenylyl-L-tyrosine phosphorylase